MSNFAIKKVTAFSFFLGWVYCTHGQHRMQTRRRAAKGILNMLLPVEVDKVVTLRSLQRGWDVMPRRREIIGLGGAMKSLLAFYRAMLRLTQRTLT
jgi:hypothetical protein